MQATVLIVDRDTASRNFLVHLFEQKKCRVLETSLGKEGLVLAWLNHPDLLVVDPQLTDMPGEDLIRKLRGDVRTASVHAVVVSSDPDPQRRTSCLEAGFSEYLVKSAELVSALDALADRFTEDDRESVPAKPPRQGGLLFVFLSAKGGTGTSSLCANLAADTAVQMQESRVAVVDGVLPIGSIAQIAGYEGQTNLITVSAQSNKDTDAEFFRKSLPKLSPWNFHLLAGSPSPESAASLRAGRIEEIVSGIQDAYDFVFVDIGRALSPISLPIIQKANLIVLVISNDLGTLTLTRTVWQYLFAKDVHLKRMFVILNRAVGLEGLTKSEAEAMIGLPVRSTIPYLEGNFSLANNQHVPVSFKLPHHSATFILSEAANLMLTQAQQVRNEIN